MEGLRTGVGALPALTPAEPTLTPAPLESWRGGPGESSSVTTTEGLAGADPRPRRGLKMVAMEGRRALRSSPIVRVWLRSLPARCSHYHCVDDTDGTMLEVPLLGDGGGGGRGGCRGVGRGQKVTSGKARSPGKSRDHQRTVLSGEEKMYNQFITTITKSLFLIFSS